MGVLCYRRHNSGEKQENMPTSFVVYYLSQAAGEDLVPFF